MIPYWTNGRTVLWQGHVLDALEAMDAQSVHCAVTSPPYWGLRDYGLDGVEWPAVSYAPMAGLAEIDVPGCAEGCEHVWGEEQAIKRTGGVSHSLQFHATEETGRSAGGVLEPQRFETSQGQYCQLCGGWRGSLGLEPTVSAYVGHLVLIFRELKRVLRDDGTFWLNLGDSYATGAGKVGKCPGGGKQGENWKGLSTSPNRLPQAGLKPKDLIGIPWRVALALQADGWWLRSDVIWAKGISFCPTYSGSCMPESVRDRPTNSYEHVFLLAKSKKYYYDATAVREPHVSLDRPPGNTSRIVKGREWNNGDERPTLEQSFHPAGRNLRSVWTINPGSYAGAHFATFPPKLVEPMIRAGTSARGACPECGAPYKRMTEPTEEYAKHLGKDWADYEQDANEGRGHSVSSQRPTKRSGASLTASYVTTGWVPACTCDAGDPIPAIVLDPFLGSGTTAAVADLLGRHSVGIELSKKYCDDHIIPRLTEPLFEWAEQEQKQWEPELVVKQLELL